MKLEFLPLESLCVSRLNMRHGRKQPDLANLLPSIRKRGILQPLLVRPLCTGSSPTPGQGSTKSGTDRPPDGNSASLAPTHEILAGRRRYHAARLIAAEERDAASEDRAIPCAILEEGDDAAALEASLLENAARLDPDEVTQWESFVRLVKAGRDIPAIADMFALPPLAVRRILALGNLLPRIRTLYARDEIDRATIRHLTLATKQQQREWLDLREAPGQHAPTGSMLRQWLMGGAAIPVRHALFDVPASGLETRGDLFGEDAYFLDPDAFWAAQNAAIAARREAWLAAGWREVMIVPPDSHFALWEHEKCPKRKGGRIYVDIRASGETVIHEAYVRRGEKRKSGRDDGGHDGSGAQRPLRPEMTSSLAAYVDLHRHAALRVELLERPDIALRLMLAHAMAGALHWHVHADPQQARRADIAESLATCPAQLEFAARRAALLAMIGLADDEPSLCDMRGGEALLLRLFQRFLDLPDKSCLDIVAMLMAESLACGSAALAHLGPLLGVDMGRWWRGDAVFPALIRDRELLLALLADVAGESVARANGASKSATLRMMLGDHLTHGNGRAAPEGWVPRWMAFPPGAYSARGGVPMIDADRRACEALAGDAGAGMAGGDREDEVTPALSALVPGAESGATGLDLDDPDSSRPGPTASEPLAPEPADTSAVGTDASELEGRTSSGAPVGAISPDDAAESSRASSVGTMSGAQQMAGHADVPACDMPGSRAAKAA